MLRVPSDISSQEFESLKIQDMTFVAYRNEVYPSKYDVFFEEHAVIVVLEGEKKFTSPTQEVHVEKGDILFIQRGFYLMSESIHEAYKSLVFFFDEKLLKEFVGLHPELFDAQNDTDTVEYPILLLKSDDNFEKFIQSVFPYFRSRTELKNHFLRLKFQELLLHLMELDNSSQLRGILYSLYKGEKVDLSFLMNSYYLKPLTLNELARLSGRSLSAFKRDFQDEFNTSPALWLKNKRLDYADFLLRNSTKNVSEISTEIGYESVSHFIKTYKEKYGTTPKRQG
ncbi:AraC family transcriptional regulator [Dyadobacter fermentans]|uniref:Transcriptional regulator, AraC family n=1 Tax=Dyadobacter fermentans (strain ATCC 700827 / DSM 18053 / CIP 107007 / KCTC 52180 / NS114) TaxID=471854 RepID=C6VV59_DYAFD|nr:response regulator transcription factor [Dyadobacter fermentans]ACT94882.1 transcriptional regulator, AraC family [Dyadobacter fermentans DSM 18053]